MAVINYRTVSRVAYITLNRPEKRNALNDEMVVLLHQAFEQAGNDKEVKVIVLKAAEKTRSQRHEQIEYVRLYMASKFGTVARHSLFNIILLTE